MTLDECVRLFRQKKHDFTAKNFLSLADKSRHNITRRHKHVGWGKNDAPWQEYLTDEVISCFESYKPKQVFTYTVTERPPADWLTLRQIANYLGANFYRIQKMCSSLTIPSRIYKRLRYAPLELFEEHLPWRPASFVRKYRSESWIRKRIEWQTDKKLEEPLTVKAAWGRFIYAPELIHI